MGKKHIYYLSEIQILPLPIFLLAKSGNPTLTNMISLNAKLGDVHNNLLFKNISILLFQESYIKGTIRLVTFWDWIFSLSIILCRHIPAIMSISSLFLFIAERYFMVYT